MLVIVNLALFNNVFEEKKLKKLFCRNSATRQRNSAAHHNTEFWNGSRSHWWFPSHHVKTKCHSWQYILQLNISAEAVSHFMLPSHHSTKHAVPPAPLLQAEAEFLDVIGTKVKSQIVFPCYSQSPLLTDLFFWTVLFSIKQDNKHLFTTN
jgi:hypothetical protein